MVFDLIVERRTTPIGDMLLVADRDGVLRATDFADCEKRLRHLLDRRETDECLLSPGLAPVSISKAIDAYFDGDIDAIQRIPVSPAGTAFQEKVWCSLRKIKPGRPISYAKLAEAIGRPQAARAVGHANAANPFCVVIPCHRLVGANGDLTGYSGGVKRKRWLLDHEARHRLV